MRGGGYASVRATPIAPPKPWTCLPAPGSYPLCSTAAAGRCTPLTCRQQVAAGQCFAPFMRVVDPASRVVVQVRALLPERRPPVRSLLCPRSRHGATSGSLHPA